jgi:N6-adenosine-specific RNA methylase IME4
MRAALLRPVEAPAVETSVETPLFAPLPVVEGGFRVTMVDSPWRWQAWSAKGEGRAPSYKTLTAPQLATLPLKSVMAKKSSLFMWTISSHLALSIELMKEWGFGFSSIAFVWVKLKKSLTKGPQLISSDDLGSLLAIGKGKTTRKASEICLLGKRGGGAGIAAHDVVDVIFAPVREDGRKPDEVYQRVERLIGGGPYLEAFARQTWPGWHGWGDQVGMFDERKAHDRL